MTKAEYENDLPGGTYLHPRTPPCFSTKYTTLRSGGPGRGEGEILPTSRRGPGGPLGPPERLFSYSCFFSQIVVLLQYVFCASVGCHDVAAGAILGAGLMSVNTLSASMSFGCALIRLLRFWANSGTAIRSVFRLRFYLVRTLIEFHDARCDAREAPKKM